MKKDREGERKRERRRNKEQSTFNDASLNRAGGLDQTRDGYATTNLYHRKTRKSRLCTSDKTRIHATKAAKEIVKTLSGGWALENGENAL